MKPTIFSIFLIFLFQISMSAQNEVDALRFSELDWQGTARFMGAGRAFGAVGAEFSALNLNPATIGLYKKSEVTFTPLTISIYKNNSDYNATATLAQAVKYNLNSAGMVFAISGASNSLWKKFQIGFGYNRIKNYNNAFSIEGRNDGKTIGSVFALAADSFDYEYVEDWENDEAWFGYQSYSINPKQGSNTSYNPYLLGVDMKHVSSVNQSGGNDEMIFSFGTNYDDKLFLGATLGVPFIHFTEDRVFKEINDKNAGLYEFQSLTITDKLSVQSSGINLKLGVIYQPLDFLRVGVAFHTPTYYGNVKDVFNRRMNARPWQYKSTEDGDVYKEYYDVNVNYENRFNYSLTTPLRIMVNAAFFIQQRAFISAEYELADYSMASMYATSYNFSEENKAIQKKYGACHIARIGAELNLNQIFAIRAGYNYISSPYKDKINDGSKHYASLGFGFRTQYIYGDFTYTVTTSKEKYWMYNPDFVNEVDQKFNAHRIMLTMGVRF
jgi:hypothetical protein